MGVPLPSHPSLSEVFTALEQAVTSFQSTHPDDGDFTRTSTYKRFFPLLRSATPPAWPAVQQVLLEQFGETSASCRAGVEAGEMGVRLVVDVLARTEVAEDFGAAMAAKLWLVQLESAVTKAELDLLRRQSATPAAAAASPASNAAAAAAQLPTPSETAQANPFAVPAPTPTPSAASTRPPFGSYTNPSGWNAMSTTSTASTVANSARARAKSPVFAQQDQHMDDPWKSDDFGPSASVGTDSNEHSRSRSRSQAPPREDTPPKVVKEKTPAPRARAPASASTSKRGTPVRSTRARSPKYTPTIDSDSSELAEVTESEDEKQDDQDDEEDDDDEDDDDDMYRGNSDGQVGGASGSTTSVKRAEQARAGPSTGAATPAAAAAPPSPAKRPAPVAAAKSARPTQRRRVVAAPTDPMETRLHTILAPLALPDLAPSCDLSAYTSFDRTFTRKQLPGNQTSVLNDGWTENAPDYNAVAHRVALKEDSNFCGSGEELGAIGQPVVLLAHTDKCNKLLEHLKVNPERGKERRGTQVFVHLGDARWSYRGYYDLAYDGSTDDRALLLNSAFRDLHAEIQLKLVKRASRNKRYWLRNQATLRNWGFGTADEVDEAVTLNVIQDNLDGKTNQYLRFVVLKCIGFDEDAFKQWAEERARGGGSDSE